MSGAGVAAADELAEACWLSMAGADEPAPAIDGPVREYLRRVL